MKIVTSRIKFSTAGNCEIRKITEQIKEELRRSGLSTGTVTVFVPGATGAITAGEYEPGLLKDMKTFFEKLAPESEKYNHDADSPRGNAQSHLKAALVGPSLTIPFEESTLTRGTWQEILFIDFDNRTRQREIIIKIIGE